MGNYIPPSSFHTFDPIRNSPDSMVDGIISSMLIMKSYSARRE